MEQARTQDRQKTASELGGMARCVVDEKWDEDDDGMLKGLLRKVTGERMQKEVRELLQGRVKGLGDTGLDIFLRGGAGI